MEKSKEKDSTQSRADPKEQRIKNRKHKKPCYLKDRKSASGVTFGI